MNIPTFTFKALYNAYMGEFDELNRSLAKAICSWDEDRKTIVNETGEDILRCKIHDMWWDEYLGVVTPNGPVSCFGDVVINSGSTSVALL